MAFKRLKCPQCDKDFGQEKRFIQHLKDEHDIIGDEQHYIKVQLNSIAPLCACGCGCSVKWNGWKKGYQSKYIRGHNAANDSIYNDPKFQKRALAKRKKGYEEGKYSSWNKGLTKETDERLEKQSKTVSKTLKDQYSSGQLEPWQKTDPEKAKIAVGKAVQTKKDRFAQGELVPWNKGLTKESDDRIARISMKISGAYNHSDMGKRIKISELRLRIAKFDSFELISDLEQEYKRRRVARLQFKCKKCGNIQAKSLAMLEETPICFHCHPKESKGQLEVFDYVRSLGFKPISNDSETLGSLELDISIPEKKFAIEYNGLYWHSELFRNEQYHQQKLDACRENGASLFTVYEDEWRDKPDIVQSMIRHRLGMSESKLSARDLHVRIVDPPVAKQFFETSHLEGHVKAKITFGLFDGEELVAAMSLRQPFHQRYKGMLEVARSASKPGLNVRGWLGKLTAEARRYHPKLMTYVDSRVGLGGSYAASGWQVMGSTKAVRFWWTDYVHRYNRFKFKAKDGKSQQQVADEEGVVKIYGCVNQRFEHQAR